MKRLHFVALPLLLLFILLAGAACSTPDADYVVQSGEESHRDISSFGGSLVIEEGGELHGDVAAFGSEVTLAGDVVGDVALFGGSTKMVGSIDGDLVVFGSSITANSAAQVKGDCVIIGGEVRSDGDSGLNCSSFGDFSAVTLPAISEIPLHIPFESAASPPRGSWNLFGEIGDAAGSSLVMGLLALALAAIAPRQLTQVSDTLRRKPAVSGAVGFLTMFAAISLLIIVLLLTVILIWVCIGFVGIPIIIGLLLLMAVGMFMGWIAVGVIVGRWLGRVLKLSNRRLTVTAALGTAVLTLVSGLLGALPFLLGGCVWNLVFLAVGLAGLGAVALTRFGTQGFPPSAGAPDDKIDIVMDTMPEDDRPPK